MAQAPQRELPPIEIEGKKYPRKEFKDLVAQIAAEHNIKQFDDPVLVHLFESREENYQTSRKMMDEFHRFQRDFMTKLQDHAQKITKFHASIEHDEINIVKRYMKMTQK